MDPFHQTPENLTPDAALTYFIERVEVNPVDVVDDSATWRSGDDLLNIRVVKGARKVWFEVRRNDGETHRMQMRDAGMWLRRFLEGRPVV